MAAVDHHQEFGVGEKLAQGAPEGIAARLAGRGKALSMGSRPALCKLALHRQAEIDDLRGLLRRIGVIDPVQAIASIASPLSGPPLNGGEKRGSPLGDRH